MRTKKDKKSLQDKPKGSRLVILKILAIILPFLFFVLLELILRWSNYGYDLSLFNEIHGKYAEYMQANPYIALRYFPNKKSIPSPAKDIFLKNKTDNTYRIMVIGGSSAAGYPYGENVMFSRILHSWLSETFPNKNIEMVNTAMPAINSFTMLDIIDEILETDTDLVLIYAGHNEYYGAMGVGSSVSFGVSPSLTYIVLKLQRLKTYELLKDELAFISSIFTEQGNNERMSLMEQMVGEQTIPYRSELYYKGVTQFQANLEEIVKRIKSKNKDVIVSELVSNIADHQPFISIKGKYDADSVFLDARNYLAQQKIDSARTLFYKAKDYDALRFRAPEEFNALISQLSKQYNFPVVAMKKYFETYSADGIIGNELMLEHLHPNEQGYALMAKAFYETIKKAKYISSSWPKLKILSARRNLGITQLDSTYAALRIHILKDGWPFKPMSLPNSALKNFPIKNIIDSIAVNVWSDRNYTLERGHVELAEHYLSHSNPELAIEEYKALTRLTPYHESPYKKTAELLIKQSRYKEALYYLSKSNNISDDFYTNKWLGQIYLTMNLVEKSLLHLEKAFAFKKDDVQLLYNYAGALYLKRDFSKSLDALDLLSSIEPNFPGLKQLQNNIRAMRHQQAN